MRESEKKRKLARAWRHNGVTKRKKVGYVTIFLRKEVSKVDVTCNMLNGNGVVGDRFTNGVFPDLDMAKTFGSHVGRPQDAGVVIVVDGSSVRTEGREKGEVVKDMTDVEDFGTLVRRVKLCLGCASGGDGLALRLPVERAV